MKLFVGNLCYTMSETALGNLFKSHGKVLRVNLITDHYTRQSKCLGYVEMANKTDGVDAIQTLHETNLNDRTLVVKEACPKNDAWRS